MGLMPSHLHLLALEQKNYPIKGEVLTSGQLAMYETVEGVQKIFTSHGIALKALPEAFDVKSKIPASVGTPRQQFTNAGAMLTMLGAQKVFVSDVSDYEGADYVIDLNNPVDSKYYEKFDMILDSGTMEHVFDAPQALENYARMVKKGGRIMMILPCSNTINHGFYSFNPNLFFDFFSANGFSDFSCYLVEGSSFNVYKKAKIYQFNYQSALTEYPLYSNKMTEVCFAATKKSDTEIKETVKPVQNMYLTHGWGAKKPETAVIEEPKKFDIWKRKFEFDTRRWRPEFIDILFKQRHRKKNLTYLGKF